MNYYITAFSLHGCIQSWILPQFLHAGKGGAQMCSRYRFRKIGQLLLFLVPPILFLGFVSLLYLHLVSLSSPQFPQTELYQKMDHWLYTLCMAGLVFIVFHAGKNEAQIYTASAVSEKLDSYSWFYLRFCFTLISPLGFTVFSHISIELYQKLKMDHWLYPSCMAGIIIVFHASKNMAQMCSSNYRQLTLVFMLLAVLILLCHRHFHSVSISFSPFRLQ